MGVRKKRWETHKVHLNTVQEKNLSRNDEEGTELGLQHVLLPRIVHGWQDTAVGHSS